MSRRNGRRRLSPTSIRDMLGLGSGGTNPNFLSMLNQAFNPPSQARSQDADPVEQWESAFLEAMDELPMQMVEEIPDDFECELKITGVFSDGMIVGECRASDGNFHLFVNHPGLVAPWGCSCPESRGQHPCKHIFNFLDIITDRLVQFQSDLSTRIRLARFDTKKPNRSLFQYNPETSVRQLLASLIPVGREEIECADETSLPPVAAATQNRIAWNVVLKDNRVEVVPTLQQSKKRGGGWTKGRKLSWDSLSSHSECFSEADQRVRDLVRLDSNSYRATYHLDSIAAIKRLIGEPNVLFNGEPTEIQLFDGAVTIGKDDQYCWLTVQDSTRNSSSYVFAQGCLTHFRTDTSSIQVCFGSAEQLECLRSVVRLPRIPLAFEGELMKTAEQLQKVLSIHLPESVAGKIVEEDYRPVLLLRSRSDGALDYGIRVRDSSGTLRLPASGLMVRRAERGGQAVQVRRSALRENQICRDISQRFALSTNEINGSIYDFEAALGLIGRLQDAETEAEVEILWDKSSEAPMRLLGSVSTKNVSVGISQKRDWFQLSGSCSFGKESIDLGELLSGLQAAGVDGIRGDYVRLGEKGWAKVSKNLREQFQQLYDSVNQERGMLKFDATSAPAIRNLLAEQVQMKASQAWTQCLSRLEQAEKLEPVLPADLNAELRDYQRDGFQWLRRLAEWGVGGILADDMGLGKTLQTLAVILDRAEQGPTLVIAPTSVGFNWVRESERFAPRLEAHLYRETERADFLQQVGPGSLVVCSYGLALRDAQALAGIQWSTLVLDEAQAIKNSRSKTSAAIATIPAQWKIALTGTPVENHLGELWSLFHVVSPGVLGGWDQFRRRFAAPIEKDNDEDRRLALRERLRPFLLRRTKEEVLKDLPPRTETNLYIEMTPAEREIYNQVRLSALGEIDQLAKLSDVQDQRFRILALLTRLRQLACSPRLVHESWKERSSKLQRLCETLHELREEGHRVLVFSQFVQHLSLIREMLDEEAITYEYLDGSTPAKSRQERVDSFQNGDASVFLISLKAGGTGLNLTAADYVIHMDPWWNPAVEDQATDRAHRIGQDKPVMVYRLVSQDTIEEEILKLHETKRDLVAGIMEGTQAAGKLSTEDLIALLRS